MSKSDPVVFPDIMVVTWWTRNEDVTWMLETYVTFGDRANGRVDFKLAELRESDNVRCVRVTEINGTKE